MSHTQVLRHAVDAAKSGNPALAKIHLQKAAEIAPDDPVVWLWMAWLADSPVSMIQCLENVVENKLYQDVAQAGLVFAQTLAGFKAEDYSVEAQQAAFAAAQQAAERGMHEKEEVGHATASSVEDAVEAAALEIVKLPSIGEALANEAPDEVIDVVVAAAVASTSTPAEVDTDNGQASSEEPETATADNVDLTEFEVEPMPLDESLGQTADNDVAAIEAINEVFELQEPIETEADETEAAETSSEAIEVVEDANDESVADAGNSIEDTQDSPAATDFTEPAAGGTPANVWRAAQSDWFGLESDTPPATNTPAGGSPPSDVPDEPKSNAREVEVIIPDVLSIRPDQAADVDVHLAEPLDVFSNHSNDDGPVVVPQVPESNDDWVSAPIKVASAEPVVEPTVAPKVVEAKLIKAEVMPKSAPTSARSDQFDELAQIDPAAEFNALADRSHGQVGGPNQPDDGDVILVVDDSPTVRKLIAMTLEKRGYKVATAFDGVAAIKEIVSHNPALILMDVTMPRLDGYQLCKLVKKHDSTRHIPVVMLTGKDGMFDRLRGRLVGCSGYITKPFVPDDLVATVEQFLTAAKQKR